GFNCMRLHHMDARKAPAGIFDPKFPDMQHLDADQLDRLDYLIYQFKQHGIYVDINLHVSRRPGKEDGFPDTEKLESHGKVVAYFEPRMIELQKNFARDLLTHLNPYTKTRYVDDPAVALIEINNEDSLLGAGWTDALLDLPDYYKSQLVTRWNAFLKQKYGSTSGLLQAWNAGATARGEEMLKNARFTEGTAGWMIERQPTTRAEMAVEEVDAAEPPALSLPPPNLPAPKLPPGRALHVKVQEIDGTIWHLQLHQIGLDFKNGETYTVAFWARANASRKMQVYSKLHKDPWRDLGLRQEVQLTQVWKRYTMTFTAQGAEPNSNRLTFALGNALGDVWLADVSVRSGSSLELEAGRTLEAGNLELLKPTATPQGRDYVAFLMEVERAYVDEMTAYIKNTLGAKGLVTCSQASYGGLGGVWREAQTDFVDMHSYWRHPNFPNKPWDPKDWIVANDPMVRDAGFGTLAGLAQHRVAGKPFTVSEYNHPAPNDYTAETMPMIAAYAAWQDWDGIFLFEYNGSRDAWNSDRIKGFFSSDSHPGKMAFMPAAATIFLRGDLGPLTPGKTLVVPRGEVAALTAQFNSMTNVWSNVGTTRRDTVLNHAAVRFTDEAGPLRVEPISTQDTPSGQLDWNIASPQSALFAVRSPASKVAVEFNNAAAQPAKIDLDGFTIERLPGSRPFFTMTLTAMDGKPTTDSASLLLTAAGNIENTGMGWNEKRNSVGNQWGTGPTIAEGIIANITLQTKAAQATVYALDGTGARVKTVPSQLANGRLTFQIGPEHSTLWYEIATG
ncbi:MAG: carbohydrate binding domain-containing protein, partial [Armatimonadota bacterium]|nr:carbohydrate binding domain-containing protein [Armatimonadota bacterium]